MSGSTLKTIAVITMIIDHVAKAVIKNKTAKFIMIWIGRTSFPIYAFLLSEGYRKTKNKKKYLLNLIIFALISEIPWNLLHYNKIIDIKNRNIYFTLALGFVSIHSIYKINNKCINIVTTTIISIIAEIINTDYGARGILIITATYLLSKKKMLLTIIGTLLNNSKYYAIQAYYIISKYNGKRGYIKNKTSKYIFYSIYPIHMIILWIIKREMV